MSPWLLLPAPVAHAMAHFGIKVASWFSSGSPCHWREFQWRNLKFPNRLGIAGGVDKNALNVQDWWKLGAGFLEVGTVTPKAQGPVEGAGIRRHLKHQALWNRLGFPSRGAEYVRSRLAILPKPHPSPLFLNVGKNRHTPNPESAKDILNTMGVLSEVADAFVINISSPNTEGLRKLQSEDEFKFLLDNILRGYQGPQPLLIKLSPDLPNFELRRILETGRSFGVAGWVLTNTTTERSSQWPLPKEGGVSGAPLATLSRRMLKDAVEILGNERKELLISVGGVLSPEDVMERLAIGADLVEVYSALVFQGPFFFKKVSDKLSEVR